MLRASRVQRDVWKIVETTRLSRDYLADGDTTPEPMPVVLRR
jgi:hypothetical protein